MILLHALGAYGSVLALCIIFCVPVKYLNLSGIVGTVGWLIYIVLAERIPGEMLSMFFAALVVSVISHLFARWKKAPVTLFLIPGILPLVPGVGMYRIVYSLMVEEGQTDMASYYLAYTLQMAGIIAIAIFITDTFFKILSRRPR